jgi:hypothetical protein
MTGRHENLQLLGGDHDGTYRTVIKGMPRLSMPRVNRQPATTQFSPEVVQIDVETEEYTLREFYQDGSLVIRCFALVSMSDAEVARHYGIWLGQGTGTAGAGR